MRFETQSTAVVCENGALCARCEAKSNIDRKFRAEQFRLSIQKLQTTVSSMSDAKMPSTHLFPAIGNAYLDFNDFVPSRLESQLLALLELKLLPIRRCLLCIVCARLRTVCNSAAHGDCTGSGGGGGGGGDRVCFVGDWGRLDYRWGSTRISSVHTVADGPKLPVQNTELVQRADERVIADILCGLVPDRKLQRDARLIDLGALGTCQNEVDSPLEVLQGGDYIER